MTLRWTNEEYEKFLERSGKPKPLNKSVQPNLEKILEEEPKKIKSKYNNEKTEVDGIIFDSKKEARYYETLKILKRAGEIKDFSLQPEFIIQEGFTTDYGEKVRPIKYIADFKVEQLVEN